MLPDDGDILGAPIEEIRDPLDGLAERAADDPGAPFAPAVLAALAALKKEDRAAFETLRTRLKGAGCRVTALDEAIAEEDGTGHRESQADILLGLAAEAELFHAPDGTGFADATINGHRETWPIRSKGFRRWLARRFFEMTAGAPNGEALSAALNVIEARAHFDGPERSAHMRLAECGGRLYLDLADAEWRAVEIDANGWRIVADPPVRFRRAAGMKPLPAPAAGGSLAELRNFVNVRDDRDFVLMAAWLLAALRPTGPYPALVLSGEQGAGKSIVAALLRKLADPNSAPLRSLPHDDRDLFIAATNGHVIAIDNVSSIPPWLSDSLCRLATGGGFATRQLYSDCEETLFEAMRPIILTGIEDFVSRADLADRSIFLRLDPIPEEKRRPEAELWAAFDAARARILGALLAVVSHGIAALPHTRLERLPRMADFALWAVACEGAAWPKGVFMAAYDHNQAEANETVIEADAVALAVRALVPAGAEWTGTATELLAALANAAGEAAAKAKSWPATARALSGRLRRAAPNLRRVGIEIAFGSAGRDRDKQRAITIATAPPEPEKMGGFASPPSPPAFPAGETPYHPNSSGPRRAGTQNRSGDANLVHGDATVPACVPGKPRNLNGGDGGDTKTPALSGSASEGGGKPPNGDARHPPPGATAPPAADAGSETWML
jgi:hypothetical protein